MSGSFLIAAYQYLLDWFLGQYEKTPEAYKQKLYRGRDGKWSLTSRERKRILLAHMFGVDVDAQAVEVTKLSLLLKVLERESADSLQKQLEMFHERALPDLGNNIKHGNSLIGPDILTHEQFDLLSTSKRDAVNPFDWGEEFPEIMEAGGFHVILGNPPYVNAWVMYESAPEIRDYLNASEEYRSADRHWDTYVLFLEKSLNLLRRGGRLSFIIPFSYCIQKYAGTSRKIVLDEFSINSIADLRTVQVFKNVPVITITCRRYFAAAARFHSGRALQLAGVPKAPLAL
jgi:Eco57I restriction-modification methylase